MQGFNFNPIWLNPASVQKSTKDQAKTNSEKLPGKFTGFF
jgi:hypothetical protein